MHKNDKSNIVQAKGWSWVLARILVKKYKNQVMFYDTCTHQSTVHASAAYHSVSVITKLVPVKENKVHVQLAVTE